MKRKNIFSRLILVVLILFGLLNLIAIIHAYRFTHYTHSHINRKGPVDLSRADKLELILLGQPRPRPENNRIPTLPFKTIRLHSYKDIECWSMQADSAKGTVCFFHGYVCPKALSLDNAYEFLKMHYNVMLVDFVGAGGSEGDVTTLGFNEAQDVTTCYKYLQEKGEQHIFLYGVSMGSVAIMKAVYDEQLKVSGIMLECPFGSLYDATANRFSFIGVPPVIFATLLDFWGGTLNGFWAFSHKPTEYAKEIHVPTLLMYGDHDQYVMRRETDSIYAHLTGMKQLAIYKGARHESYLHKCPEQWKSDIKTFLKMVK
ncbi:MAG: alpha/beta hydrolase [Bacteroidota bacterium]